RCKITTKSKAKNRQIKIEPHFCPLERNEQKLTSLLSIRPETVTLPAAKFFDRSFLVSLAF
ncbi:MAG: hypothetical protein LBJ63_03240, partial [Prevotellaceae bacterium]|nr:hypothetical protein [Prevotellaceae bacterium]